VPTAGVDVVDEDAMEGVAGLATWEVALSDCFNSLSFSAFFISPVGSMLFSSI